ncbi:hypothetical protein ACHAW5_003548 [Stephanodiscus triporus]|uniref:Minichromosome loss protein Mcl1 middle region domain-containing protein n=1 Tax=Stephanodiscus triporus TaxID=2934178 RepID=A0ABD3MLI2_9STRA
MGKVMYLPGRTGVQCRIASVPKSVGGGGGVRVGGGMDGPPKFVVDGSSVGVGHLDSIVVIAVEPPGRNDDGNNNRAGGRGSSRRRIITGGRDGRAFLWEVDVEEGTGEAVELKIDRAASSKKEFGVPPVTDLVWRRRRRGGGGEAHVAFADGTVFVVPTIDADDWMKKKTTTKTTTSAREASGRVGKPAVDGGRGRGTGIDDDDDDVFPADGSNEAAGEDDDDVNAVRPGLTPSVAGEDGPRASAVGDDVVPPKGGRTTAASRFVDDEAEDGGDDDNDDGDDDEIQYDDVVETRANAADTNDLREDDDVPFCSHDDPVDFDDHRATAHPGHAGPSRQPPFSPSSTPLGEPRRILCWNHVGVVTLREDDADGGAESNNNLVDIAFHETAGLVGGRRPITFTDNLGFIVGTLGEEGGMFATDLLEDDDDEDDVDDDEFAGLGVMSDIARKAMRRSKKAKRKAAGGGAGGSSVYFHRFETFGRNADKDWVMALPDGERVLGCATGGGWGAVITSRRFLRLFTVSGLQGPVLWIPGEPVTIVGRDRFVAIFYHRSAAPMSDGTQLLGYSIFDGLTGATVAGGDVSALSHGASLTWVGFNETCALSIMDSEGMFSMLARYPSSSNANNGNWMPLLDTVGLKKSTSDTYWPVEIHGGKLVCVLLRGGRVHPDAARRPVTTTLSLRIPMATSLTAKSGPFEECSVRAIFALNQEKVLDEYLVSLGEANEEEIEEKNFDNCRRVDKVTLKLFSSVVQAGKVERGFDLVQRLHSEKTMDLAIQIADRLGHRKLSDRIEEMKLQKYPPIDEYDEGEPFDDAASFDSGRRKGRSGSFDGEEEEPVIVTRQQRLEHSQKISPDGGGLCTPRQLTRSPNNHAGGVKGEYSTDEESPPHKSLKRKIELDDARVSKKRMNPFAKKMMESPAKGIMKVAASPTKLTLSRASTFSAKSRQKQRSGKQIV